MGVCMESEILVKIWKSEYFQSRKNYQNRDFALQKKKNKRDCLNWLIIDTDIKYQILSVDKHM